MEYLSGPQDPDLDNSISAVGVRRRQPSLSLARMPRVAGWTQRQRPAQPLRFSPLKRQQLRAQGMGDVQIEALEKFSLKKAIRKVATTAKRVVKAPSKLITAPLKTVIKAVAGKKAAEKVATKVTGVLKVARGTVGFKKGLSTSQLKKSGVVRKIGIGIAGAVGAVLAAPVVLPLLASAGSSALGMVGSAAGSAGSMLSGLLGKVGTFLGPKGDKLPLDPESIITQAEAIQDQAQAIGQAISPEQAVVQAADAERARVAAMDADAQAQYATAAAAKLDPAASFSLVPADQGTAALSGAATGIATAIEAQEAGASPEEAARAGFGGVPWWGVALGVVVVAGVAVTVLRRK